MRARDASPPLPLAHTLRSRLTVWMSMHGLKRTACEHCVALELLLLLLQHTCSEARRLQAACIFACARVTRARCVLPSAAAAAAKG